MTSEILLPILVTAAPRTPRPWVELWSPAWLPRGFQRDAQRLSDGSGYDITSLQALYDLCRNRPQGYQVIEAQAARLIGAAGVHVNMHRLYIWRRSAIRILAPHLPPRPRCRWCQRRRPDRDAFPRGATGWDAWREWIFCSPGCQRRWLTSYTKQRRERERQRKWLNDGKQTLRQIRQHLKTTRSA